MKTTAQRQAKKKESTYVATATITTPCDIEVIVNRRRTVALSKRDGLFFLDDMATLKETEAGLLLALEKVQRLIRAGS